MPLELWLAPTAGPLLPRLRQALAEACGTGGEPLRWAITAADPSRGLRLEAVLIQPDGAAAQAGGSDVRGPGLRGAGVGGPGVAGSTGDGRGTGNSRGTGDSQGTGDSGDSGHGLDGATDPA